MVAEVMAEGESLLIFTQFTELGMPERYLRLTCHYNTYYIHGGTNRNKREQMIGESKTSKPNRRCLFCPSRQAAWASR